MMCVDDEARAALDLAGMTGEVHPHLLRQTATAPLARDVRRLPERGLDGAGQVRLPTVRGPAAPAGAGLGPAGRPDITVTRHLVETFDEAERVGFHGSPGILIDCVDPFADPDAGVGMACRTYQAPDGPSVAPTLGQLRAAVAQRP